MERRKAGIVLASAAGGLGLLAVTISLHRRSARLAAASAASRARAAQTTRQQDPRQRLEQAVAARGGQLGRATNTLQTVDAGRGVIGTYQDAAHTGFEESWVVGRLAAPDQTFAVRGGFQQLYAGMLGPEGVLGYPTGEERRTGTGSVQQFQSGRIEYNESRKSAPFWGTSAYDAQGTAIYGQAAYKRPKVGIGRSKRPANAGGPQGDPRRQVSHFLQEKAFAVANFKNPLTGKPIPIYADAAGVLGKSARFAESMGMLNLSIGLFMGPTGAFVGIAADFIEDLFG